MKVLCTMNKFIQSTCNTNSHKYNTSITCVFLLHQMLQFNGQMRNRILVKSLGNVNTRLQTRLSPHHQGLCQTTSCKNMTTCVDVESHSSLCYRSKICSLENIMETSTLKTLNHSYGKEGDICALAKQTKTKVPTTLSLKATCYKQLKDAKKIQNKNKNKTM